MNYKTIATKLSMSLLLAGLMFGNMAWADETVYLKCKPLTSCSGTFQKKTTNDDAPIVASTEGCNFLGAYGREFLLIIKAQDRWSISELEYYKRYWSNRENSSSVGVTVYRDTKEFKANYQRESGSERARASIEGVCEKTTPPKVQF